MLVMTLKTGEAVVMTLPDGRECRVKLFEVRTQRPKDRRHYDTARLACDAPREIRILRGELVEDLAPPAV